MDIPVSCQKHINRPLRTRAVMNNLFKLLLSFILIFGTKSYAQGLPAELTAHIDTSFTEFNKKDSPGYVVGIVKNEKLVFNRAYGMADLDHGIPLSSKTAFHLASLSKQFTGAAAALLILEGKLKLTDPVAKWIPDATKFGQQLKVEHLVYMTSGLPEYWDRPRPEGTPWHSFHIFDNNDMLRSILSADKLDFAPGTKWRYTNSNYIVLAKIVEMASGKPLSEFLSEKIFGPLDMRNAHLNDDPTLIVPGRATGYVERNDLLVAEGAKVDIPVRRGSGWARLPRVSPHYGGSGVFASLEDLVKWDRNWYKQALGPGFTELMHKRVQFPHGKDNDAFGLVREDRYGLETWVYSGSDLDTSTYMARFPTKHISIICLSNMPTGQADEKCRGVLDMLHDAGWI